MLRLSSSPSSTQMPSITNQPTLLSTEKRWAQWQPHLIGIALLPLIYLMLILKVGSHPILMWDESRLAINAAEMDQNGNWLVTHFGGEPDMWNTKPPFVIWLEVLSLRLFGYSEVAFRLPTVVASVTTAGLVYTFVYHQLKSVWGGIFSVVILITAFGYNDHHAARTGDYDAILTLWMTVAGFSFFRYMEEKELTAFAWTVAALILAVLTKGIAGLFWLPAFLLYAIFRRRLWWLLRRPEMYVGAITAILVVLSYYLAREYYNPGYLKAVSENELGGRLLTTLEQHLQPWDWYILNMYEKKFVPWVLVIPFSFVFVWRYSSSSEQRNFTIFAGLVIVSHLIIISSSATKLYWYDIPIYPLASIIVALSLGMVAQSVVAWQQVRESKRSAIFAGLLFTMAVITAPVLRMYDRISEMYSGRHTNYTLVYGRQIKSMATITPELTDYIVYSGLGYNASMIYYTIAARKMYGHHVTIKYKHQIGDLKAGDLVMACGEEDKAAITARFNTMVLVQEGLCTTWLLQSAINTGQ
jgi:4-amino-4-deoxy-L-arabinose transferase-like glycosyltransferase